MYKYLYIYMLDASLGNQIYTQRLTAPAKHAEIPLETWPTIPNCIKPLEVSRLAAKNMFRLHMQDVARKSTLKD